MPKANYGKANPFFGAVKQLKRRVTPNPTPEQMKALGPLADLWGTWKSKDRGWNMIALPFQGGPFRYRLLLNQYEELLKFNLVGTKVPNRGITLPNPCPPEPGEDDVPVDVAADADGSPDQFLASLDYVQSINQIAVDDAFDGNGNGTGPEILGERCDAIHHEPGLWLHMIDEQTDCLDIARLATIPHGDAVLALGRSETHDGAPRIPTITGLPVGTRFRPRNVEGDLCSCLSSKYLGPYRHFHENKFEGLFDPVFPAELLEAANEGVDIESTTVLEVDTTIESGGIHNIPFIVKQANAASMKSTFWIQRLKEKNADGSPKMRLQYLQVVRLDFFPRGDGTAGRIEWPHVSINTLEKVSDDETLECKA